MKSLTALLLPRTRGCLFMSTLSSIKKTRKAAGNTSNAFVDFRRVVLQGGAGGDGCIAFEKLFANPEAGPSGGDGGHGGHVVFEATENVTDLSNIPALIRGKNGVKGQGKRCHGANADHTFVKVPVGTVVTTEAAHILSDLSHPGDFYIGGRGGAGGKGNSFFLSNELRAPRIAEFGAKGESRVVCLELKVVAAAGLVGFPNVGKSTLLRALSRARPKVANYPFTTLRPHVGVVESAGRRLTVADIPGLIDGAHMDVGLGSDFLRHVERCRLLVFVVDVSGGRHTANPRPLEQLRALKRELELYLEGLSERRCLVVANKCDLVADSGRVMAELRAEAGVPVVDVSAKHGANVEALIGTLFELHEREMSKT